MLARAAASSRPAVVNPWAYYAKLAAVCFTVGNDTSCCQCQATQQLSSGGTHVAAGRDANGRLLAFT